MKLRDLGASGFFVVDSGSVGEKTVELVSYFLDGILEVKIEDSSPNPIRLFRVFSIKFGHSSLEWAPFTISEKGLEFYKRDS